ncbi:hypothetical protein IDH50_18135 [Aeromicrobium tamlense]|uniref:Glucan phosphoethanolaminetransferase (Alkaline phosphatase superfamily) n=1 Tax=Aeromicrobium tamlense TaxID=375541 RepID=A0A8I0KPS4_9ACTN|nr:MULTISPECIES: hypothetical protein [Aeromicrobium]MBD1272169.1 hypothetical protein [Aeromicrobium tamlense]NYI38636.1 glucan phosphoethanolaminetransferase (alkaline phosphatase superfamily) [Aeromicrobium tamlense]
MKRRQLAPWIALAVIVVCTVVAAAVVGVEGLLGAIIGGVIVLAFFATTPAVLGPVAKATPGLSMMFALIFFFTKVVALLALFVVLQRSSGDSGPIDPESVSVTVIATTLAWLTARLVDATRDRTPMYDLPEKTAGEPGETGRD